MEVDVLWVIGFSLPCIGLLVEHFHYQALLQERLTRIETKIDPFWKLLENNLPAMLLRGNPIALDSPLAKLLEKQQAGTISQGEVCNLIDQLQKEMKKDEHSMEENLMMLLMVAALRAKVAGVN